MNWAPGHGTNVVQPSRTSMQTDMRWKSSTPYYNWRTNRYRSDGTAIMAPKPVTAKPTGQAQLKATQMTLPEAKVIAPANWDQWYQKVAKAIYAQWCQQTTIGPGSAMVVITVFRSRDIDCKIESFTPVDDKKRNLKEESAFKAASLRSVSSLNQTGVWEFPVAQKPPKKVTFDMEFKHAVGSIPGCQVVHTHDNKAISALQDR